VIGLYAVVNTLNGRAYVGSSSDVRRRLIQHKSSINTGKFIHYQGYAKDAKAFGASAFEFKVLAETETIDEAKELEEAFLQLFLDDLYNVADSSKGGGPKKRANTKPYIDGAAKRLSDPDYRLKLSEACKGKRQVVKCPHCSIEGGGGNMRRYHFDKCKAKQ